MKGEKIAEKNGYILLENIPKLEDIIENWDNLEDNFYVAEYDYNIKDFKFYMRKYLNNITRIWVCSYHIEIKRTENKIEIKFDDVREIQSDMASILDRIFVEFFSFWIKYASIKINSNGKKFYIDLFSRRIDATFELTDNEREIRNSINYSEKLINRKYLALVKINNRERRYYVKRFGKIPTQIKIMIRNRKISYMITKMLLNKEILEKEEFTILPEMKLQYQLKMKLKLDDIIYMRYKLTPIYHFNEDRINLQGIRNIKNFAITDYDYDGVNQIIFKIIAFNEINDTISALCGVDYRNMLWCVRISDFMQFWKIKEVYKFMYKLDENTKLFEF